MGRFLRGIRFYAQHWAGEGGVNRPLQAEEVAGTNTVSLDRARTAVNPGQRDLWFGKLSQHLP